MRYLLGILALVACPLNAQDLSVSDRIEQVWRDWAEDVGVSVWSMAIGYNGDTIVTISEGRAPSDVTPLVGLSKPITVECVRRVLEEHSLTLDAPLSAIFGNRLQELGIDHPENGDLTVASLITHTALSETQAYHWADLMFEPEGPANTTEITANILSDNIRRFKTPRHVYGVAGYIVLGQVIMTLTGQDYVEACRDRLFDGDPDYQIFPPIRAMEVNSGWQTTPEKYLGFAFRQFGEGSDLARDPFAYPSFALQNDEYYGMGAKFTSSPEGTNHWLFSNFPYPFSPMGSLVGIYENGWGVVVTFDGQVHGMLSIGLMDELQTAATLP